MSTIQLLSTGAELSPLLYPIILIAGIGTTVLFGLSLIVYIRRRTRHHLFITLALAALLSRSIVGFATVRGLVPMNAHHIIEHTLDFLIAALILLAVYYSRREPSYSGS